MVMNGQLNGAMQGSMPLGLLAAQQLAPQGAVGNWLAQNGAGVGGTIGSMFGNQGLGQTIGGIAGQLGRFLPFDAGPQFVPQGAVGNWLAQNGAGLGGAIGGAFGNQGLGQTIGGIAGQLGRFLPFDAGPQLAPQGIVGNALGRPIADGFGYRPLGQPTGMESFLPFDAGPQLAPQGIIGSFLGSALGGIGGGALGGLLGNRNIGKTIGSTAGGILGGFLPFDAGPQFVPQGTVGTLRHRDRQDSECRLLLQERVGEIEPMPFAHVEQHEIGL
jgi:hypothetical protein